MTQPNTPSPSVPSAPSVTFITDIERATHLIPGFLKKTLAADDKQWMTQFLDHLNQQGGATALEFAQEMAWVERSQQQLAEDAPSFDAQSGWQRLQARLDTPALPARRPVTAGPLARAAGWVREQIRSRVSSALSWWKKPVVGVLASAMIVGQMGLLAAVVKHMNNLRPIAEVVTPSSGAPSLEGQVILTIVFKDSANLLDVRSLIANVEGRVVDGPGAIGVWQVAVPKANVEASIKRLSTATAVESVTQ